MPRNWPKVEELYHAALVKDPAEREAFIAEACGGNHDLRNEVRSSVDQGLELSLGIPRALFKLPDGFVRLFPERAYELHPDGRHFVVGRFVKTAPPQAITRLELAHNWFTELERLAPTRR